MAEYRSTLSLAALSSYMQDGRVLCKPFMDAAEADVAAGAGGLMVVALRRVGTGQEQVHTKGTASLDRWYMHFMDSDICKGIDFTKAGSEFPELQAPSADMMASVHVFLRQV